MAAKGSQLTKVPTLHRGCRISRVPALCSIETKEACDAPAPWTSVPTADSIHEASEHREFTSCAKLMPLKPANVTLPTVIASSDWRLMRMLP